MKKLKSFVNGTFAVVLLIIFTTSCGFKEVSISSIDSVSVSELESNRAEIIVVVTVTNENSSKVVVKRADLDLLLNERFIGKAILSEKVTIPPSGKNQIEIPLTIRSEEPLAMLATKVGISSIFSTSKVRVNGEVKGSMNLISHKISVDETQELSLDKLKDLIK